MSTRTRILEEIAYEAGRDTLDEATPCTELGGAPDLDDAGPWMVEIIYGLELAYDIAIEDDEAEDVWQGTVGDLVDLVEGKVQG